MNSRGYVAAAATLAIFLLVQAGALLLVEPFEAAGYQTVPDPQDPTNSVIYLGAILVATAVMLVAFRYGADALIKGLVVFSSAFLAYYVLSVFVPPLVTLSGFNGLAILLAAALGGALVVYPEWYVIDGVGILMGMGAAGLFGISFGLLPAILLLTVLAVYDAISVYGTKHMLTLASGVMDLKIPVVLVVPLTLDYSFLDEGSRTETTPTADGGDDTTDWATDADEHDARQGPAPDERDAFFIGLGDAVMPTIMVASAAFFTTGVPTVLGVDLPAFTALVGTNLGLLVLVWLVMKGRAHAGLPLLNGGAIGGYLVGATLAGIPLLQAVGLAGYL